MGKFYKEGDRAISPVKNEASLRLFQLLSNLGVPMEHYRATHHGAVTILREILPIIEFFSNNVPSKRRGMLRELGIIYPDIFWYSVRHGIMHNPKQFQTLIIDGDDKGLICNINWDIDGVVEIRDGFYSINPIDLYDRTVKWLMQLEKEDPEEKVSYNYSIIISRDSGPLYDELRKIHESM